MCAVSAITVAQDAAGQYKLTGVDVLYTYVARGDYILTVTDAYGFGITQAVSLIPGGAPFASQGMQLSDAALAAIGINLNVTLNEDGSGAITEGSYYPDVNTIVNADGSCTTLQQVLPVSDEFTYSSMGNMMEAVGMVHPGVNVIGLPADAMGPGTGSISPFAGQQMGGLELQYSGTFEDFPMFPEHPTLCSPDGACFPFTVGDIDGSGTLEIYPDVNLLGIPEYIPGGYPLTGLTAGYFLKEGLNTDEISSVFPGNTDPSFHLEWHGIDGAGSGLGWGDDEELDEDEDGTWFDRLLGVPGITATYMNPACGFNQPVYGDVSGVFPPECVDYVGSAASGVLMDPSGSLATWGNFLTGNAAQFSGTLAACEGAQGLWNMLYGGCIAQGADAATCSGAADAGAAAYTADGSNGCMNYCGANYGADDSDHDFNGVDGRLTMNFDIPCVPIIEAREVVAEFIEVGGSCGSGDVNADGAWNVMDVVALVGCVLSNSCDDCSGDVNNDGAYNVMDVVALVNCVLNNSCGGARIDRATSAEFNVIENEVTMTADGLVGGIQMTLSHGNDFELKLTDGGQYSNYLTEGNSTTLIIVNPTSNNLFTANGGFTIEHVIVSDFEGTNKLSASVNMMKNYSISAAYPNPFNPTTQMSLTLNTAADVSVKVFNMNGQLVDVIANGQMSSGSYSFTWDGTSASSGVYFIQTEVGSEISNQKIMLVK